MRAQPSQMTSPTGSGGPGSRRSDARRNRAQILRAAHEAFATQGIDVPMATIARHAGVGTATLYRHFPSREALATEVFADKIAECSRALEKAADDPDPWHGLTEAIHRITAMQVADRGLSAMFLRTHPSAIDVRARRAQVETTLARLVRRAKDAGSLRSDVEPADIFMVLMAVDGVRAADGDAQQASARRLVAHFLRSFGTDVVPRQPLPQLSSRAPASSSGPGRPPRG